jgi:ribosomal protein S18 acetylase RimI-like enzyme
MQSIAHLAACSFKHQRVDEELESLPGKYAAPGGVILLAWDGSECVGCAAVRPLDENGSCELKRMYVRSSARGQGLGRQLCERAMARARAMGYQVMKLDSDPELVPALALYRSLGFTATPRYNTDPDPHTIYMAREL